MAMTADALDVPMLRAAPPANVRLPKPRLQWGAALKALKRLLNARTELSNLLTYMDGKSKAEELIGKVLNDPALLKSLAAAPKPADAAEGGDAKEAK